MKLIDAHCHLNDSMYDEDLECIIDEILKEMEFIVCSGWDYESSLRAIKLSEKYDKVYATIGYHPTDISKINDKDFSHIEELARTHKKVIGIGEIGLDYHWMKDPKDVQKQAFTRQIEMIRRVDIPIVIHTRDALEDTINILKEYKDVGGILHCFPGSYESVKPILDRYYVSVGGTLTFKNNVKTKELVSKVPLDRIVIETDSPYLTPVPFRGKRNNPVFTKYVAEEIARIKEIDVEQVINQTSKNAIKAYRLENLL
ncbi:TatD family hydrolase [Caviibacter abscessus]|uniref:TatD family hydrolase n=1 Tax=Caviibacter abscessus TaxID=1766719 RepID=UPI00082A7EA0|nr:TatD family hydrolase [Caviibacter abscessus]